MHIFTSVSLYIHTPPKKEKHCTPILLISDIHFLLVYISSEQSFVYLAYTFKAPKSLSVSLLATPTCRLVTSRELCWVSLFLPSFLN